MAKFKKLAILSTSLLSVAMLAGGVACSETVCEHTYEKKSDATHTWYACTKEGCDSIVGKEAIHVHSFVNKTNTEGTKTWYECTCGAKTPEENVVTPHVHDFALQKDADNHWYACTDTTCDVKVGEAEHIWDEGEETKPPEVGSAGEYTYTCKVCEQTDVDPIDALEPNPLLVAEGSGSVTNVHDDVEDTTTWGTDTIEVPLTVGSYLIYVEATNVDESAYFMYNVNDTWSGACQFDVTEDGTVSFDIQCMSSSYNNTDVTFDYVIAKVPSVTPSLDSYSGEMDIVTYAYVKVSFNMPVAGRYMLTSNDAMFAPEIGESGDSQYLIETTEDGELVEFYAVANDASEDVATVAYELSEIYPKYASEGKNSISLLNGTKTEVVLTVDSEGIYKVETFDDYAGFWKNKDDVLDTINGISYIEVTEDDYNETYESYQKSFYVTAIYNSTSFKVSALTDEDLVNSSISWTFDEGETVAKTTATLAKGSNLIALSGMGLYQISWTDPSISLNVNGVDASTQSVVVALNPRMPMSLMFNNNGWWEAEDTFTLTMLDGINNAISASTEIYVMGMVEIPAQLTAGDYEMSISSETAIVIWGFDFSTSEGTAMLSTTAQTVTATGEIETLYVQGGMTAEFVTLTITAVESGNGGASTVTGTGVYGDPYILPTAGYAFSDLTFSTNPMGMVMNILVEYTATEDGVMTVTGVNSLGAIYDADNNIVELIENTLSFNVVAGTTYTIEVCPQDMANSPVSPVFTFSANA